jgi:peroxisomal 2,4-dienoyl-CoA reductase
MSSFFVNNILKGRVAFVTGGGTGITGGVARALAEAGANVALVSRSLEHLEPAAKAINEARDVRSRTPGSQTGKPAEVGAMREGPSPNNANIGEAFAVAADVRNPDEVEKAIAATIERFGRIDIVVNGAAGNFLCTAEELSPNGFGTVVDIDLKGTFNVCRAAFAELKKNRGQILNISATLHYLGTPMQLHVSAAKAGVDALTKNLAVEWGRYGIRVNAIAPGPIGDTEGMKRLVPEPIKEKLKQRIPLGRFGLIEDIENAAVFLCSDAASYINGAVIVVDGGHWLASNGLR